MVSVEAIRTRMDPTNVVRITNVIVISCIFSPKKVLAVRPAITRENSPRGTSNPVTRRRIPRSCAFLVAHQAVRNFVPIPVAVRTSAGNKIDGILVGSIRRPKNRKKIAEKRSRNGANLTRATIAKSSVKRSPTKKAATAPENLMYVAAPDAKTAEPKTTSRSVAESPRIMGAYGSWNIERVYGYKPQF